MVASREDDVADHRGQVDGHPELRGLNRGRAPARRSRAPSKGTVVDVRNTVLLDAQEEQRITEGHEVDRQVGQRPAKTQEQPRGIPIDPPARQPVLDCERREEERAVIAGQPGQQGTHARLPPATGAGEQECPDDEGEEKGLRIRRDERVGRREHAHRQHARAARSLGSRPAGSAGTVRPPTRGPEERDEHPGHER